MRVSMLLTACLAVAGCSDASGGGTGGFPADPYSVSTSDQGLRVEVRTSPTQPPPRGTCSVELRVTNAAGAPVDGLAPDVVPWMAAMGHGASVRPSVVAKGGGAYEIDNLSLFMPGTWELHLTFHGSSEDHATASIAVP